MPTCIDRTERLRVIAAALRDDARLKTHNHTEPSDPDEPGPEAVAEYARRYALVRAAKTARAASSSASDGAEATLVLTHATLAALFPEDAAKAEASARRQAYDRARKHAERKASRQ